MEQEQTIDSFAHNVLKIATQTQVDINESPVESATTIEQD